jgi:hypothetical protein
MISFVPYQFLQKYMQIRMAHFLGVQLHWRLENKFVAQVPLEDFDYRKRIESKESDVHFPLKMAPPPPANFVKMSTYAGFLPGIFSPNRDDF